MDIIDRLRREYFGWKFSCLLNEWKEKTGKTQTDFWKEAGVSKNIVTAWKRGERYPREAQMIKICDVFEVDRTYFSPKIHNVMPRM